jgi:hypothetical protein
MKLWSERGRQLDDDDLKVCLAVAQSNEYSAQLFLYGETLGLPLGHVGGLMVWAGNEGVKEPLFEMTPYGTFRMTLEMIRKGNLK